MSYLFDVYPRFNVTIDKAKGAYLWDDEGKRYLDFYGGHGVISIGHGHPEYISMLKNQLDNIGFYSNSVGMPVQEELAKKLVTFSDYDDYKLFLCNSGTEANENALKLASFHTGKKKVIAFKGSFHGRTSAALNVTDNPNLSSPLNHKNFPVIYLDLNDEDQIYDAISHGDIAAVIVEGIQGVGGLDAPTESYLKLLSQICKKQGIILILDEVQSGFGRTGKFFAHQYAGIQPDIISMAKGMGNGFPIGGVLINPSIKAKPGLLGTTFGGNPLACAASLAVLDVMGKEEILSNVQSVSSILAEQLKQLPKIKKVKGKGLMLGAEFDFPVKEIREKLVYEHHIFTGSSSNPNLLRILPPLVIEKEHVDLFINAMKTVLS
ncbi:MAG: aspartate aminotransferase family protein [Bacteroidales bacterium]|nr:aspartate aminotransferase family protein [Bacteroidales bacterium]